MTLLADVVTASREVTETSSRSAKVQILAELLRRLDPSEVGIAVGFLAGAPRHGRVGIGYSTIYGIECPPAREPSLRIEELDRAIDAVRATTGSGSAAARKQILGELLGRATEGEADFVKRLFTGGMWEGGGGRGEVGLELFRPISPVLASPAASVPEGVASFDRSSVEWKLDGIR